MGIYKLSNHRMYWPPYSKVSIIADTMPRNHFEELLRHLHYNGNSLDLNIYIHKRLNCNLRNDLCVSDKDKEILTIEISRENDKNILLSCCYRPPNGDSENLSMFLQNNIIEKSVSEKKMAT